MTLEVFTDLVQGSDEWLQARCGVLTASTLATLVTPTLKVANNDTSRRLIRNLATERITGHVEEVYVNADMERGNMEEPLARDFYANHKQVAVDEVGFILKKETDYTLGYSPDGMVGDDGLIEIKSRRQGKHVETILNDAPLAENMAQLQVGLFVTGRQWIDYISYSAGMPFWTKRVYPDPKWFDIIPQAARQFETAATEIIDTYKKRVEGLPLTERTDLFTEIRF